MAIHVAVMRQVNVDAVGNIVHKNSATINQMAHSNSELRVIESEPGTAPNALTPALTPDYPTVTQYLIREDADGFTLIHLDNLYIITRLGGTV